MEPFDGSFGTFWDILKNFYPQKHWVFAYLLPIDTSTEPTVPGSSPGGCIKPLVFPGVFYLWAGWGILRVLIFEAWAGSYLLAPPKCPTRFLESEVFISRSKFSTKG